MTEILLDDVEVRCIHLLAKRLAAGQATCSASDVKSELDIDGEKYRFMMRRLKLCGIIKSPEAYDRAFDSVMITEKAVTASKRFRKADDEAAASPSFLDHVRSWVRRHAALLLFVLVFVGSWLLLTLAVLFLSLGR